MFVHLFINWLIHVSEAAIYEHIIILVDYLLINTRETCYNCSNVIGIVSDLKQNWLQIFDNIVHEHACTKRIFDNIVHEHACTKKMDENIL